MVTLEVEEEFGYVVLVVAGSFMVNLYQTILVINARKKYNVAYPDLYAPESNKNAKQFNSVQRGHQNTLESWAPLMIVALLNGLVFPRTSASLFALWSLSKAMYAHGYAKGGPSGRVVAALVSHVGEYPLIFLTFYTGANVAGLV